MKKALILLIATSMICVSISGAAVSVNNSVSKNVNPINEKIVINQPTESSEVNTQVLNRMNQEVDKYLNLEKYNPSILEYIENGPPIKTTKEVEFPWSNRPIPLGDFLEWIIHVNYNDKHFEEEIDISVADFKERFLKHPLHYEYIFFDVDENGEDDLKVHYSFFTSNIYNNQEGIDVKSLETMLKVRTENIADRTAKLEVWSEIKLNFGLIREKSRDHDRSLPFNNKFTSILNQLIEKLETKLKDTAFTRLKNILTLISKRFHKDSIVEKSESDIEVLASDDDWISAGIGVGSPKGENIPLHYEKRFAVGKYNIFKPMIFEHELKQTQSRDPLDLLFGFRSGYSGNQNPSLDVTFGIDFDPAIYICTQFIPRTGYIYYGWDSGSGHSQETQITFYLNFIKTGSYGSGELEDKNVELTLIFDKTSEYAQSSNNWISFDVDLIKKPRGFLYKANKKFDVGILVTSPSFSAKAKVAGLPTSVGCWLDVDLSFTYQPGQLLDVSGSGSVELDMNNKIDGVTLYYPELGPDEPKVEFFKATSIASTKLSAGADLYIKNGSMTTIRGGGHATLSSKGSLGKIQVFYRKADPNDPDKLFIDIPYGIPAYQAVGANAELYMDLDDFSNPGNYIYGRLYRTASGDIDEISGYLPGETEPIVRLTEIPAHVEAKGKLEWNKLKGYAYARRQQAGGLDPVEINIDIGTFSIYNKLTIRDGTIDCRFHLNEDGYFYFDTTKDMLGDILEVEDTSSGDILEINVDKVSADDLWVDWDLDMSKTPIPIEDLSVSGALSALENFVISATYEGKGLEFSGSWKIGQEGIFSLDFNQDDPIEITVDDLFPDDPTWDVGGGVIISEDFHFDLKWKWQQGGAEDPGYFKINEDTNDPNFDWIGVTITYDPNGNNDPQYGIEVGGYNIGVIVYLEWWKKEGHVLPQIAWYVVIQGNFDLHLLWNGEWYYNVEDW